MNTKVGKCKSCEAILPRRIVTKRQANGNPYLYVLKICQLCERENGLDSYYRMMANPEKRQANVQRRRSHYARNRERINKTNRDWIKRNPDKQRKYRRTYYLKNRLKEAAYHKAWKAKNRPAAWKQDPTSGKHWRRRVQRESLSDRDWQYKPKEIQCAKPCSHSLSS